MHPIQPYFNLQNETTPRNKEGYVDMASIKAPPKAPGDNGQHDAGVIPEADKGLASNPHQSLDTATHRACSTAIPPTQNLSRRLPDLPKLRTTQRNGPALPASLPHIRATTPTLILCHWPGHQRPATVVIHTQAPARLVRLHTNNTSFPTDLQTHP